LFLYDGYYLSLPHRLAGLKMMHEHPNAPREVSFEYLNQQLLWGELQNFVIFLLPLLAPRSIASTPFLSKIMVAFSKLRSWQGASPASCLLAIRLVASNRTTVSICLKLCHAQ
jgi:hypothetical protein